MEASEELDAARRRYSIHPLTRAFARAKLDQEADFKQEAHFRTASHFLDFARQNGGWQNWEGLDMLKRDLENILAMIGWCYDCGEWQMVIDLVSAVGYFLGIRGHWHDRISYGERAIHVCERIGDWQSLAWFMIYDVGWTHFWQGNREEAVRLTEKGQQIGKEHGYEQGVAMALRNLGHFAIREGRCDDAQWLYEESLKLWRELGDLRWAASTQRGLGIVAELRKDYDEAWQQFEEVRIIYERLGDEIGLANVLLSLGWVAEAKNNLQQARIFYEESLRRFRTVGDLDGVGNAVEVLAMLKERLNEDKQALELALEALDISERLGRERVVEEMRALVERLERKLSVHK